MNDKTDRPEQTPDEERGRGRAAHPIVGIGGSAGAIDALKTFLPAVPPDSGIAYVVVLHLDPDHKSLLGEVLGRETKLPVEVIDNDTPVAPNTVYVIPPNAVLTIKDTRLHVTRPAAPRGSRNPIDSFLVSL